MIPHNKKKKEYHCDIQYTEFIWDLMISRAWSMKSRKQAIFLWQTFLCEENRRGCETKATAQVWCTISADVTYMEDLQSLLFHQTIFTHSQLSEVFIHGEEATVGVALHMFRPGTK